MILGVLADDTIRSMKVGIITTRRLGNAVVRVQTRRRLRGILQRLGDQLTGGHAMVIIPHASCAPATSAELERDWWKLVKRAGLVNDTTLAALPTTSTPPAS